MRRTMWLAILAFALAVPPAQAFQVNADAERRIALLRASLDAGRIDEAVAYGEEAVELDPGRSATHHWLARALGAKAVAVKSFTELYWLSRTEEHLLEAIKLDGKNLEARFDLIQFDLARRKTNSVEIPPRVTEQAAAIAAQSPFLAHLAWATIYSQSKEAAKAEESYKKALAADPKSLRALAEFVDFYASRLRFPEAMDLCTRFAAANPEETIPFYLQGKLVLMSGKNLESGLSYFDKFLAKEPRPEGPSHADAWWRKGMILEQLGKKAAAQDAFKKAVTLDPDHKEAKAKLPAPAPKKK